MRKIFDLRKIVGNKPKIKITLHLNERQQSLFTDFLIRLNNSDPDVNDINEQFVYGLMEQVRLEQPELIRAYASPPGLIALGD